MQTLRLLIVDPKKLPPGTKPAAAGTARIKLDRKPERQTDSQTLGEDPRVPARATFTLWRHDWPARWVIDHISHAWPWDLAENQLQIIQLSPDEIKERSSGKTPHLPKTTKIQSGESSNDSDLIDFDVIVFPENENTVFDHATYQATQRLWPLARILTVYGPWSAGSWRSGKLWPGAINVPWTSWPLQLMVFGEQFFAGVGTLWDGPLTTSINQRLTQGTIPVAGKSQIPSPTRTGIEAEKTLPSRDELVVHVLAREYRVQEAIEEACLGLGWKIGSQPISESPEKSSKIGPIPTGAEVPDPTQPCVWVWDLDQPSVTAESFWKQRAQLDGGCIAISGFLEIQSMSTFGMQTVTPANWNLMGQTLFLRKPFMLPELQAAIGYLSLKNR